MRVAVVVGDGPETEKEQLEEIAERLQWCQADVRICTGNQGVLEGCRSNCDVTEDLEGTVEWLQQSPLSFCINMESTDPSEMAFERTLHMNGRNANEICIHVAQEIKKEGALLLGVVIRKSRMKEFSQRKFFTLAPTTVEEPGWQIPVESGECQLVTEHSAFRSVRLLVLPLSLDEDLSLNTLSALDGILFKASDFLLARSAQGYVYSEAFMQLVDRLKQLPNVCVIDSLEKTKKAMTSHLSLCSIWRTQVLDRSSFPSLLPSGRGSTTGETSLCSFPPQFVMDALLPEDEFSEQLQSHRMHFPVIAKPVAACGSPSTHSMAIVYDSSSVTHLEMDYPLSIQQFYHHGGRLWKIYVVGSHVFLEKEASLDVTEAVASGVMHFNALEMKKHATDDNQGSFQLDPSVILSTAEALRMSTGLTVFGFDVIVDVDSRQAFVVDVNHFPSMKRVKQSIPALYESLYNAIYAYQQQQQQQQQ